MARSIYATIQDIRDEGYDASEIPDARALKILERAADTIERLTGQFFGPKKLVVKQDGRFGRLIYEPGRNKIIEFISLFNILLSGDKSPISSNWFEVKSRAVKMQPGEWGTPWERAVIGRRPTRFLDQVQNVELTAVFGHIDVGEKIQTTLATPLTKGDTTVTVTDSATLEKGHILFIDDSFWLINQTDGSGGVEALTIDPSCGRASAGASVVVYGSVLADIVEASLRTALANRHGIGSSEASEADIAANIKSEKTDNYTYTLATPTGGTGKTGASRYKGTGDPRADAILSHYKGPKITGRWV